MRLCRNVYLIIRRFHSSTKYFSMDNLLPPREIRGMKKLNRELFEKIIKVPCILVKLNDLREALKVLKPHLLKMVAFNPVRIRNSTSKEILLNPFVTSFEDLNVEAKKVLDNLEEKVYFEYVEIKLGYENWKASEVLNGIIPKELGSVSGYSVIGHIVHLNLRDEFKEYKRIIGEVLLDKIPQVKTVVNKEETIDNEYRTFRFEVIAGIDDFFVEVVENHCKYKFDFSKVYWNPRLSTEHMRVVERLNAGDYLYDAFAGVGPFTIPAAKKGCTVLANDLNSEAIAYLRENLRLNKVEKFAITSVKDAGDFIREDFKSHFLQLKPGNYNVYITMNLPALAPNFLPNFKGMYCNEESEILKTLPIPEAFIYCFIKNEADPIKSAKQLISEILDMDLEEEIKCVTFVRNVAPNKEMMRITLALTPKILISAKRCGSPLNESKIKKTNTYFLSQEEETKKNRILEE